MDGELNQAVNGMLNHYLILPATDEGQLDPWDGAAPDMEELRTLGGCEFVHLRPGEGVRVASNFTVGEDDPAIFLVGLFEVSREGLDAADGHIALPVEGWYFRFVFHLMCLLV